MSESAKNVEPEADEAVRAYIRMNGARLAADGALLALLLPERFVEAGLHDLQRHIIDKLRAENAALKRANARESAASPRCSFRNRRNRSRSSP